MKLVVDTNILFSFFWKGSVTSQLLMTEGLELFSPEYALEEIHKHQSTIRDKTGLAPKRFKELLVEIAMAVEFVPLDEYKDRLKRAATISPDLNDADFFALAMKLELPIWSNDTKLKKQQILTVVTTSDLLSNPGFCDSIYPID